MRNWEHIPLWEQRPLQAVIFGEEERAELEHIIALQVATLLSNYGCLDSLELDDEESGDTENKNTFAVLFLEPFELEDDGDLIVAQAPMIGREFDMSRGLHCVQKLDEDGYEVFSFSIWDPKTEAPNQILDRYSQKVDLSVLQELYEALAICTQMVAHVEPVNEVPHNTTDYPTPMHIIDVEPQPANDYTQN